jgi:hypothetical protein
MMKTNHLLYPWIILILLVLLISGCSGIKGYGKVRLSTEYGDDMTIQKLQDNWHDYHVSYAGVSIDNPSGIMFDPIHDDRELVGDSWTRIEDRETASEIISWIKTYTQFNPRLHVLLGQDNQLYGYVFYAWSHDYVVAKLIDDRTLYVYDIESPNYLMERFEPERRIQGQTP